MVKKLLYVCVAMALVGLPFSAYGGDFAGRKIFLKTLGSALYKDANLSINGNQSCMSCHHPSAGFADPDNKADPANSPVSDGSINTLFGGRNAPTAAYAGFSPKLHWDAAGGLFIGGLFWDGRASGLDTTGTGDLGDGPTGDPLADQAKGPFLNSVEMALGSEAEVVNMVRYSWYAWLFETVFPGVLYDDTKIGVVYNHIATAIAAFERSLLVNRFNSKFDKFVMEQGGDVSNFGVEVDPTTGFRKYAGPPPGFRSRYFSYNEADGLALFNADSEIQLKTGTGSNLGGMCYLCHLTARHNPDYGPNSTQSANPLRPDGTYPPLLTDFSYDNLGIPKNPIILELTGSDETDYGLGAAGRVAELSVLNAGLAMDGNGIATHEQGKHRVATLRDIDKTPPYGHNGFFPTLYSIVHFYNTRDNPWPGESFAPAEVPDTVNADELGNLGLSYEQEQKIVLFLKTLSDD